MNIYWENKLKHFWLIISAASVLLPLSSFLETEQGLGFSGVMMGILAVLFVSSAPLSIFALPLIALFKYGIELDIDSMFGAYFYIVMLNILGYLQWFWLMPKYLNHGKDFKLPTIMES